MITFTVQQSASPAIERETQDGFPAAKDQPGPHGGPRLLIVCCRCQGSMGTRPCDVAQDGEISHGYCHACCVQVRREWQVTCAAK